MQKLRLSRAAWVCTLAAPTSSALTPGGEMGAPRGSMQHPDTPAGSVSRCWAPSVQCGLRVLLALAQVGALQVDLRSWAAPPLVSEGKREQGTRRSSRPGARSVPSVLRGLLVAVQKLRAWPSVVSRGIALVYCTCHVTLRGQLSALLGHLLGSASRKFILKERLGKEK